jgi:GDSL-like Lipase/Acylhydrolase family
MASRVAIVATTVALVAALTAALAYVDTRPGPRLALFGDSLSMQAGQDFEYLAAASGAPVLLRAYNGWAICDVLPHLAEDVASWKPNVAVIEFSGNVFTPCMKSYTIGTAPYYAKYRSDAEQAIDILRDHGVHVVLIGVPLDAWANLNENVVHLNAMYAELAATHAGVTYSDAGQSVLSHGTFTWTLPCLPFEPCEGSAGVNVVRAPDGVHFCPTGQAPVQGIHAVCNVYSSGAFRFAAAMVSAALHG